MIKPSRVFRFSSDMQMPVGSWIEVAPASMQLVEERGDQVVREASFPMSGDRGFFVIQYPAP